MRTKQNERLQGYRAGYTAFGCGGEKISDSRRYQMLGNSLAIPCAKFVLGNIAAQMRELNGDFAKQNT
jgi:DNA (cytosine-5)-methyltransferase 1